jgi:hypothetical protein
MFLLVVINKLTNEVENVDECHVLLRGIPKELFQQRKKASGKTIVEKR